MGLNFSDYFEKLSKFFAQIGAYCPRLKEYEQLFRSSKRFRDAIDDFYANLVIFCTKALHVFQEPGKFITLIPILWVLNLDMSRAERAFYPSLFGLELPLPYRVNPRALYEEAAAPVKKARLIVSHILMRKHWAADFDHDIRP